MASCYLVIKQNSKKQNREKLNLLENNACSDQTIINDGQCGFQELMSFSVPSTTVGYFQPTFQIFDPKLFLYK